MVVELLYFDGCPSYEQALENLEKALRLEGVGEPVQRLLVPSVEDAERYRFQGSPTIRIDGVDLEGPDADKRPPRFSCRLYREGGQAKGWPSTGVIQSALQRARERMT
jgi:hypothetical protein